MAQFRSQNDPSSPPAVPEFRIAAAELDTENVRPFLFVPDAAVRARMADEIAAVRVARLRFEGMIEFRPRGEWRLTGDLGATVTQPCVVSLEPVSCRVQTRVLRRFLEDPRALQAGADGEMPSDDSIERLADFIDLYEISRETLLLELPGYPRRASLEPFVCAAGGGHQESEDAEREKPFSILRQLKKNPENQ